MKYVSWFLTNIQGIKLNTFVRILVGILQISLGLGIVWLSRTFIDVSIKTGSRNEVIINVLLLFFGVVAGVLLRQLYFYLTVKAETLQSNAIRIKIFSKLFSSPLYDGKTLHSGDVTSRLAKDIELVSNVSTDILPRIVIILTQLGGAFFLMRYFDKNLAWLLILVTPLAIVLGKLISHKLKSLTLAIREQESSIQMRIQESIEQNAVLRSLCAQKHLKENLDEMQTDLRKKILRRTSFTVIIRILLGLTFSLGYMTAFVWGGLQLRSGAITFGTMTSFLQLVGLIQNPILTLLNFFPQVIQSAASIDRLEEMEFSAEDFSEEFFVEKEPQGIIFKDVTFRYSVDKAPVIEKFNFCFPPSSKTAIIGRTGIGKTTLFRLMLSLAEVSDGEIYMYSSSQKRILDKKLRGNFVFVPQGNSLISGTIRYNLLLGDTEEDEEKLFNALKTACADFVFDLPNGLDTVLNEKGGGLSEGQAQRIAIARGLLRPGTIFLLDEISSSLDEETEKELFERIFKAFPKKTLIFITHRPAVEKLCSQVLKLE